ncbi:hypothetical protein ANANG_G00038190 [Anguilla anguilla]|uniref:Uncharacterized protein n=1 Tax=Anguilla anguilla TaxID=7936 RepID=A0A9D3MW81_ANGAN|nr:hypothetical protein ANANG_G00038190 [Anguilla anguilla]
MIVHSAPNPPPRAALTPVVWTPLQTLRHCPLFCRSHLHPVSAASCAPHPPRHRTRCPPPAGAFISASFPFSLCSFLPSPFSIPICSGALRSSPGLQNLFNVSNA